MQQMHRVSQRFLGSVSEPCRIVIFKCNPILGKIGVRISIQCDNDWQLVYIFLFIEFEVFKAGLRGTV
jgi:hypothetical protein